MSARCGWSVAKPGSARRRSSVTSRRGAHNDGAWILYGRCDEDLGLPYQPWIEALTALVVHAPDDVIAEHVAARGGALARLVPELSARAGVRVPVASDADAERYALFGAVSDLLTRIASVRPTVVVLDDLHWADKPTVQLLRHVVGVVEPTRLLVVGTYRPADLGASHPLIEAFAALRRERGIDFVDLGGLGDLELLQLMEGIAGHEMDDDVLALRDAIAAETDGNPFFATEILRHLLETGAIAATRRPVARDDRYPRAGAARSAFARSSASACRGSVLMRNACCELRR